jgi:predicted nucleotide-binding protein (sugar kinase/HSP70/actin superfamily)
VNSFTGGIKAFKQNHLIKILNQKKDFFTCLKLAAGAASLSVSIK